ncbi:hypothetical protein F5Y05DRAFT_412561 [Hypoxylon sp. FL0543]|nr:hypothetical protein F5Y05DRAFT_412561 [Hypoxylon sp. FL0543]
MIAKISLLQAMLVLPCLFSAGLGKTQENRVAWLRDVKRGEPSPLSKLEPSEGTPLGGNDVVPREEQEHVMTLVDSSVFLVTAEKRDPKRPKNKGHDNDTQDDTNSGSVVGKTEISMPLSIGVGIAVVVLFLQNY